MAVFFERPFQQIGYLQSGVFVSKEHEAKGVCVARSPDCRLVYRKLPCQSAQPKEKEPSETGSFVWLVPSLDHVPFPPYPNRNALERNYSRSDTNIEKLPPPTSMHTSPIAQTRPTMAPTQAPLHVEILLTPPCANPQIAESPELSLLHTTILATLQAAGTAGTTELAIPASLKSLTLPSTPHALRISRITTTLCEDDPRATTPSWRVSPTSHLYAHDPRAPGAPAGASVTAVPCAAHEALWERLVFDAPVKSLLLSYALARSRGAARSSGFVLLHGPPGGGKSSLALALAQKLAVRRGPGRVVRLSHAALSKFFGESARRVEGVFEHARSPDAAARVVVVVVDEVESFGMARAEGGGDGTRVTNALLTGLDGVRAHAHVLVVGTSNGVRRIDAAVVDRADVVLEVGATGQRARDAVLRRVLDGLVAEGVLDAVGDTRAVGALLAGVSARRVEGCVVVALGLAGFGGVRGCGTVEWATLEAALRKAAGIVAAGKV